MSQLSRIDSHLHLWDLAVSEYSWLTPALGRLYDTFTPEQAAAELRANGVGGAVLVQAEDSLADTQYLLDIAQAHPWGLGVVGWIDLARPAEARTQLERWREHPAFCGVRHLINDDPRADFLDLPEVRESLSLLIDCGMPFDIHDAWPRHLAQATRLASELPGLTVVLDHLGKPPRGDGVEAGGAGSAGVAGADREPMVRWAAELREFAARPNTVVKLSGLAVAGHPFNRAALQECFNVALEAFGPDRMMYGGDWPVAPDGYGQTLAVLEELIGELSRGEQDAVLGGTASSVYGLGARPADRPRE